MTDQTELPGFEKPKPAKCECGQEIAFVRMDSGKMMPIELPPVKMVSVANMIYSADSDHRGTTGKMVPVHVPHWQNCPLADKFRKGDK